MNNVRGTYDYLPNEQMMRNRLLEQLRTTFEVFGFEPIETPTLVLEEILAAKYAGGAEIMKEVYGLNDQKGRRLGLRYDLTVPFARFVGMNNSNLEFPFKKYEIGKVFRDGPVKRGRKREFYQADVDLVGVTSFYAEVEFFQMIEYVAKTLGIKMRVEFNDRRLLYMILERFDIGEDIASSVILTLDKLKKIEKKDIIAELCQKGINQEKTIQLLEVLSFDDDVLIDWLNEEGQMGETEGTLEVGKEREEALDEFEQFRQAINRIPSDWVSYEFSPSLARGLEVYTGIIWEVFNDDICRELTASIAAGGRYNRLIRQLLESDVEYPAVGMTFGVDVLMELLKEQKNMTTSIVDYGIIPMKGCEMEALSFANRLRLSGIKVEVDISGKRVKKSMNRANNKSIPYMSVIGEDEIEQGWIRVKNMETGLEDTLEMGAFDAFRKLFNSSE